MNDEPQTLLRIELREPSVYNSILEAISNGCNKIREIADRIHEEKSKCSKYMLTLQTLRLIEKCVPCTEPETSKKDPYPGESVVCSLHFLSPLFSDLFRLVRADWCFKGIPV